MDRRRQLRRLDIDDRAAGISRSERLDLDHGARIAGLTDRLKRVEPRQCRVSTLSTAALWTSAGTRLRNIGRMTLFAVSVSPCEARCVPPFVTQWAV
jgi:hypothetical protein